MSDKEEGKNNESSEEEEETSEYDYDLNTLEIKKESLSHITLNISDYNYLIEQLNTHIKLLQQIKNEKYPNTFSKEVQTLENNNEPNEDILDKKNLEDKITSLQSENHILKGKNNILQEENERLKEDIKKNNNNEK